MKISTIAKKNMELAVMVLAFLMMVLYLLPIYKVEIFGESLTIALSTMTFGYEGLEGNFWYIFALVIPLFIILMIMLLRSLDTVRFGGSAVLAILDIIIIALGTGELEDMGSGFGEVTFWPALGYIFLAFIIIFCILLLLSQGDTLTAGANSVASAINDSVAKVNGAIAGAAGKKVCPNCGAELESNAVFCAKCGTKYVAPELKKCQNCGTVLGEHDVFCQKCGTKYEKPVERVCPNCGAKCVADAVFCEKCGTKIVG